MKLTTDVFAVLTAMIAAFWGLFGLVPALLSEPSTFHNIMGVVVAAGVIAATAAAGKKLYERFMK